MFRFLNNLIRYNGKSQKRQRSNASSFTRHSGQIAVILIFVIAILFIFFSIALNLGKIGQLKTLVTIASNQSAAILGALMASYAESIYQYAGGEEKMGDDLTVCKWANWVVALFKWVVLVAIAIIVTIINPGFGVILMKAIAISAIYMRVYVVLQLAVIEPEITNAWNKMVRDLDLDIVDDFLERGVSIGLQNVATDSERVADIFDMDMDGFFGAGGETDKISRYSIHYTNRLARLDNKIAVDRRDLVDDFKDALVDFVFKDTDNWGVWDDVIQYCNDADPFDPGNHECCYEVPGSVRPPECNCCGLPIEADYNGDGVPDEPDARPTCCDHPSADIICGSASTCPVLPWQWPYLYDPLFENVHNNNALPLFCNYPLGDCDVSGFLDIADCVYLQQYMFGSGPPPVFDELCDVDQDGSLDIADLVGLTNAVAVGPHPVWGPICTLGPNDFLSLREFLGHDDNNRYWNGNPAFTWSMSGYFEATGAYENDDIDGDGRVDFFFRADDATGIFPTLWYIQEHINEFNLPTIDEATDAANTDKCRWCDDAAPGCAGIGDLTLPDCIAIDPTGAACCATKETIDVVHEIRNIFIEPDECPDDVYEQWDPKEEQYAWWKPGVDEFCSVVWQYDQDCPGKHCPDNSASFVPANEEGTCDGDHFCTTNMLDPLNPAAWDLTCSSEPDLEDFLGGGGFFDYSCGDARLGAGHEEWYVEDRVDRLLDEVDQFLIWANKVIETPTENILASFKIWYEEASKWIRAGKEHSLSDWVSDLIIWTETLSYWVDPTDQGNFKYPYGDADPHYYIGTPTTLCFPLDADGDGDTGDEDEDGEAKGEYAENVAAGEDHDMRAVFSDDLDASNNIIDCLMGSRNQHLNWAAQVGMCRDHCLNDPADPWPAPICTSIDPLLAHQPVLPADCSGDGTATAFTDTLQQVQNDLNNMGTKLQERLNFLRDMYLRLKQILGPMNEAIDKISGFLNDGRVTKLRQAGEDLNTEIGLKNSLLRPWAIYAWKDDFDKWHVVKSEARIPGKCAGMCSRHSSTPEPIWPILHSYTQKLGTRRCKTLGDSFDHYGTGCSGKFSGYTKAKKCFQGGRVKSRIIRYDEERDLYLEFINKVPIWKSIFHHPERNPAPDDLIDAMEIWCNHHADPIADPINAFMTNDFTAEDADDPEVAFDVADMPRGPSTKACYNTVGRILERGVMAETCADYYFHTFQNSGGMFDAFVNRFLGKGRRFEFKFVPCGLDNADPF